jgi:RNA polymerase sigma-70 factor (ECF subfamily)
MSLDTTEIVTHLLRERVRLTAVALLVLGDAHAADDVFQQVTVDALESGSPFQDAGHLTAWALRVARYRAVDAVRKRAALPLDDAALEALAAHWADRPAADAPARVEALQWCVARLPADAREVLHLRYEAGLSCGEVAARLRRTVGAVYQTLSRLHRRLRDCIEARAAGPLESAPR